MAMFRRFFAAQQNGGDFEQGTVKVSFDFALLHQSEKAAFIFFPCAPALLVRVQHHVGRGQQRLMNVFRSANLAKEEFQIVSFGEASQLRGIVQTDVDESTNAGVSESFEELPRRFLGETDGIDFHLSWLTSANKLSWGCA